jgi:hypothetical protein
MLICGLRYFAYPSLFVISGGQTREKQLCSAKSQSSVFAMRPRWPDRLSKNRCRLEGQRFPGYVCAMALRF